MKEALKEAYEALSMQEVPVGCVFVYNGKIIGRGSNRTNVKRDATRHAEIEAADNILLFSEGKYTTEIFQQCTLYVTCEPCIMCAAALAILKIRDVVYGCSNDRFGGCGSVLDVRNHCSRESPPYPCTPGIMQQEGIEVLQNFYLQVVFFYNHPLFFTFCKLASKISCSKKSFFS